MVLVFSFYGFRGASVEGIFSLFVEVYILCLGVCLSVPRIRHTFSLYVAI